MTVERSLTQVFRKNRTDFDAWGHTKCTIARVLVCLQLPGRLPFRQVERWRAEHQLQFPSSYRCTLHMYRMQVSQIWLTRGGRKTVTKANNRKHKTRTAKTLGVEPFSVEKTKPSLAPNNRSPCHWTSQFTVHVLDVGLSPALLTCHRSEKIEISCSNSFSGLIFQVLRAQRSSVSITLSVFKQKE